MDITDACQVSGGYVWSKMCKGGVISSHDCSKCHVGVHEIRKWLAISLESSPVAQSLYQILQKSLHNSCSY